MVDILKIIVFYLISNRVKCFKNYTLFEISAYNSRDRELLYWMHVQVKSLVFLNLVTNEAALPIRVLVLNTFINKFEKALSKYFIQYQVVTILEQNTNMELNDANDLQTSFLTLEKIEEFMDNLTKKYPQVEKKVAGVTYTEKQIYLLKISSGGSEKPVVFITAGEDSKDWMSVAVVLKFVDAILSKNFYILNHYEFYIIPVCNPDGYKHSMTVDRFWSKNLKLNSPKTKCDGEDNFAKGVTIDRNWVLSADKRDWATAVCGGVNMGPSPLSEEESTAIYNVVNQVALKLMAFINVRGSAGTAGLITIPYAKLPFQRIELINNHNLLMEILSAVTGKLKSDLGSSYFYGTSGTYFYNFIGNCADWIKNKLNVPMVYTVHLETKGYFNEDPYNIPVLAEQLSIIVNETLILATDVYGPLFSEQTITFVSPILFSLMLLHLMLF